MARAVSSRYDPAALGTLFADEDAEGVEGITRGHTVRGKPGTDAGLSAFPLLYFISNHGS